MEEDKTLIEDALKYRILLNLFPEAASLTWDNKLNVTISGDIFCALEPVIFKTTLQRLREGKETKND